jgi:ParB-like chromosome segregation protein Spo0J
MSIDDEIAAASPCSCVGQTIGWLDWNAEKLEIERMKYEQLPLCAADGSGEELVESARVLFSRLADLDLSQRIQIINQMKRELHSVSPFAGEPVDCVIWVHADSVGANDYNPNSVAPPEMKLLERSITEDGYTQPIVAWANGEAFEVVDGFHRNRVGKESKKVSKRIHGHLPLAVINDDRLGRSDRMAATIRHNRARGKHKVQAMSDIVIELKRRNWSDNKIADELGMEPDEVLRLCQISGLVELFSDQDFSASWDIEDFEGTPEEFVELTDSPEVSE